MMFRWPGTHLIRSTGRNPRTPEGCAFGRISTKSLTIASTFTMESILFWLVYCTGITHTLIISTVQGRRTGLSDGSSGLCFVLEYRVFSPTWCVASHGVNDRVDLELGFLICVPMLEEWKTPEGIKVVDGWGFQVRPPCFFCNRLTLVF
jgi:hypothetical protein